MKSRGLTLKAYVVLWVGSILLACVILGVAWYVGGAKVQRMNAQVFNDANAVDAGRRVEVALLDQRRNDLLWRITGNRSDLAQSRELLALTGRLIDGLGRYASSRVEKLLVDEIRGKFRELEALSRSQEPPRPLSELRRVAEDMLVSLEKYLVQNESEMAKTVQASHDLQAVIRRWSIITITAIMCVLAFGSIALIVRVVKPAYKLTRAAQRFGQGDVTARVSVGREDELGALCRTFNTMADDITNQEKHRQEFVAKVAHDLKNPLVTIGGAARMMRNRRLAPEEVATWLDRIVREVNRLEHMAHNLMDSVQVSTGDLMLIKTEFDLSELVEDIKREHEQIVTTHPLTLETDGPCCIEGDRDRLERAVANLVSNAVKYSPKGSPITLRLKRRESQVVFTITDQGMGMSPEEVEEAFRAFARGHRTRYAAKGTGLGLPIVRDIVEAHGGRVHVESQPGNGTTIELALPAAPLPKT